MPSGDAAPVTAALGLRRTGALLADTVVFLGAPPWWLLIPGPALLIAELFLIVIPVVLIGFVPRVLARIATRERGKRVCTAGEMLFGLRPVASDGGRVLVRADDLPDSATFPRCRRAASGLAVALALGWLVFVVAATVMVATTMLFPGVHERAWTRDVADAQATAFAFLEDVRAGGPDAGERYVADQAAEALPRYRDHVEASGVKAHEVTGYSGGYGWWGASDWEFMMLEVLPVAGEDRRNDVSVIVQRRWGRFVVTGLSWGDGPAVP